MPDARVVAGWGRAAGTAARVVPVTDAAQVPALLRAGGRGVVARGLGRSYGDAAQSAGGTVLDLTPLARVRSFDVATGVLEADAGLSLDRLLRLVLPFGWTVPVSPGTRYVTLGGAVAADVHGKNHHVDGSLGAHLTGLRLVTPDGVAHEPAPGDPLFRATVGGMGLTGVLTRVALRLQPVETASVVVDTERADDLDDLLARLREGDARYRYSVAWVDLLARGRRTGRAVLTRGDPARLDDLPPRRRAEPLRFDPRPRVTVPGWVPGGLLRPATVRAFNEAWFRKAPRDRRGEVQGLAAFFHPLDGVLEWNRVYGPRGFLQYQLAVPDGAEDVLRHAVDRLSAASVPSFLAVLKRFGPEGDGLLSFPTPGWTLALDVPTATPGLGPLLDGLDERVAAAGGRVYLAKDSRLRPEVLPAMYPRLDAFREVRARVDPRRVLLSDLARRLDL